MIKVLMKKNNEEMIVLGLNKENIKRLQKGQPIMFNLAELGIEGMNMLIFTGDTEESMAKDLMDITGQNQWPNFGPKVKN